MLSNTTHTNKFFQLLVAPKVGNIGIDDHYFHIRCTPLVFRLVLTFCFVGEAGIVAQISEPIASAQISEYYISSFYYGHVLVSAAQSSLCNISTLSASINPIF